MFIIRRYYMDLREKIISKEHIYTGNFLKLEKLSVELPNGGFSTRDVVRHPGGVAIIAETNDNKILFVEQFRTPIEDLLLEVPAGKLEYGEDPYECALRELEEETGYKSDNLEFIGKIVMAPGFSDEFMHFYYAKDLYKGVKGGDEDEFIDIREFTLDEINEMIRCGKITDSKTISGIKLFENRGK